MSTEILQATREDIYRHVWVGLSSIPSDLKDEDHFSKVWERVEDRWNDKYFSGSMQSICVVYARECIDDEARKIEDALITYARAKSNECSRLRVCNCSKGGGGRSVGLTTRLFYVAWADTDDHFLKPVEVDASAINLRSLCR